MGGWGNFHLLACSNTVWINWYSVRCRMQTQKCKPCRCLLISPTLPSLRSARGRGTTGCQDEAEVFRVGGGTECVPVGPAGIAEAHQARGAGTVTTPLPPNPERGERLHSLQAPAALTSIHPPFSLREALTGAQEADPLPPPTCSQHLSDLPTSTAKAQDWVSRAGLTLTSLSGRSSPFSARPLHSLWAFYHVGLGGGTRSTRTGLGRVVRG